MSKSSKATISFRLFARLTGITSRLRARIERQEQHVDAWRQAHDVHGCYSNELAVEELRLQAMHRRLAELTNQNDV